MNTWPGGHRHAMSQTEHESWNANNYPGTRQLCEHCGYPTGRCEDDSLYADEDHIDGPLCLNCYRKINDGDEHPADQAEGGAE